MTGFLEKLPDWDPDEELPALTPAASGILKAIKWVRTKRIKRFLATLDHEISQRGEEARRQLEETIESEAGAEVLYDYAEAVVRTSSPTATAALAILYGDTDHTSYPLLFKVSACQALAGTTEVLVDFFLELIESAGRRGGPLQSNTQVAYFLEDLAAQSDVLSNLGPTPEWRLSMLDDLIKRGLILRDIGMRFDGGQAGFCIAPDTPLFVQLLRRARSVRPAS